MSDQGISEREYKNIMTELAKVSVANLQKVFTIAPGNLTWEEIESRMVEGEDLKSICNIDDSYMESSYNDGKDKLEREDYAGAKEIFSTLCLYDQKTPKYWSALAKSLESQKLFKEALECYKVLVLLTGGIEPLPYLCMGYCYLSLGDKENALEVLENGREICDPYEDDKRQLMDLIEELIAICKA